MDGQDLPNRAVHSLDVAGMLWQWFILHRPQLWIADRQKAIAGGAPEQRNSGASRAARSSDWVLRWSSRQSATILASLLPDRKL